MEDLGSSVLLGFRHIESIFLGSFREHGSTVREKRFGGTLSMVVADTVILAYINT